MIIGEDLWARVARQLPSELAARMRNLAVEPHWLEGGSRFWYRRDGKDGCEYVLVTAATGRKSPAFDHDALRRLLPDGVDFQSLEILSVDADHVTVAQNGRVWTFDGHRIEDRPGRASAVNEARSPDGRFAIVCREGDLWVRALDGSGECRLTRSAQPHFEWAKSPDQSLETLYLARRGIELPPIVLWSPDSRKIFTYQLDERRVRRVPLVQHVPEDGSPAPILHELRNAYAGDSELPMAHQAIIDVVDGTIVSHRAPPVHVTETSGIEKREAWWRSDGSEVFFLDHDRFERDITLVGIDAATGEERRILSETSNTFVDVNVAYGAMPNIRILDRSDEIVWFSQCEGWGHLYLHDLSTGARKTAITSGPWPVCDLLHVDTVRRRAIFLAGSDEAGGDPYLRRICSASLDGGEVRILTPEAVDHSATMRAVGWPDIVGEQATLGSAPAAVSPDGRYLVHMSAGFDDLGRSLLRSVDDGALVAELEHGECDEELTFPERLSAYSADGKTRIFGVLWLPENFDPAKRYPVVDLVYPGPQCIQAPRSAFPVDELSKVAIARAITELGMAVVMIDGRGTPYRSKAFHDLCHGNLGNPGYLTDHVAALRELAAARPYLDLSRVAIMGHSAGGHAAARGILAHPEVYRVAVATAGSHDLSGYNRCWPEKWQGELIVNADGSTSYDAAANRHLAHRLEGALLLGHGDMDENVHPALTLQLAAALQAAGKHFELLLSPNDDHATLKTNLSVTRQKFEFLVKHLCGTIEARKA
ncbi:prolyl oligopeptidase family serine peptidase [Mesorhizobium sp. CAU 1732]|uniref:S9 family peptidase n=1 Tax=Mesorhizobium sp. CAU 1732 TaxID=3140358 RepID=UPI003261BBC3